MVSGSFWVVSAAFRWFQVVPRFSEYDFWDYILVGTAFQKSFNWRFGGQSIFRKYKTGTLLWHGLTLSWQGPYHIGASPLICSANWWFGFYIIATSIIKELKNTFRSSHQRCSIKKAFLKYFAIFTGKHLCCSLF